MHLQGDSTGREGSNGPWRHFRAIDRISRYAYASLTERARALCTEAFLDEPLTQEWCPEKAILADRRNQFRAELEPACQELGISHREDRAHDPRRNADVERLERTLNDESYRRSSRSTPTR